MGIGSEEVTPESIPMTAWEQGAIIVIFALLLLSFLGGLYYFMRSLLRQLQQFISDRDEQWQNYWVAREQDFTNRNGAVIKAIEAMTAKITDLTVDLQEHAQEQRVAIAVMQERTRPRSEVEKERANAAKERQQQENDQ